MLELPPFHPNRPGLVAPVRVDPTGRAGPTRARARGPRWRTTSRGLVVPVSAPTSVEQRIVEGAAVLGEEDAVTGWAALRWQGGSWFDGTSGGVVPRDVPLVAARHLVAQPGSSLSQEFLAPFEIVVVDGLPITGSVRSVVFEMRYAASLGDAVIALDLACYSDLVSLDEVRTFLGCLGPKTGVQQAREALAEADENSWSPRETSMRGVWTRRAGLGRPLCNAPVFTLAGGHIGTPDLIDPELGLVAQYNGADHLSVVGLARDLRKEAAYRDLGLEVVTMVAPDWRDLDDFTRRLQAASGRARRRAAPPGWTCVPPEWWTDTRTVEQRRALTDRERHRLLRYRRAA